MAISIDIKDKRIGLDIDGVLANFMDGAIRRAKSLGYSNWPECCHDVDTYNVAEGFHEVMKDAWLSRDFWMDLKPLPMSMPVPFTPTCYITSRPISSEITAAWLAQYHFPTAPVITVPHASEKLSVAKAWKLDLFVDDLYTTVRAFNQNGIPALLYRAPYQRGHADCKDLPTISALIDIANYIK